MGKRRLHFEAKKNFTMCLKKQKLKIKIKIKIKMKRIQLIFKGTTANEILFNKLFPNFKEDLETFTDYTIRQLDDQEKITSSAIGDSQQKIYDVSLFLGNWSTTKNTFFYNIKNQDSYKAELVNYWNQEENRNGSYVICFVEFNNKEFHLNYYKVSFEKGLVREHTVYAHDIRIL
jgi:hypothetical protein